MTRILGQGKVLPPDAHGVQKAEEDSQQLIHAKYQLKNINFLKTRDTLPHTWSSKVSMLSNFTPRMSRLGQVRMKTPDKTKSLLGGMDIPGSAHEETLSFIRIYHYELVTSPQLVPIQVSVKGDRFSTTASSVESSA